MKRNSTGTETPTSNNPAKPKTLLNKANDPLTKKTKPKSLTPFQIENQKLREENDKLHQRDARFQLLSLNSPNTILFQNQDLKYSWVIKSKHFLDIDHIVGKSDFDIFPSDVAKRFVKIKQGLLISGENYAEELVTPITGIDRHLSLTFHVWHDETGIAVGIATYLRDMSDEKNNEKKLSQRLQGEELVAEIANKFINAEFAQIDKEIPAALQKMAEFLRADRGFIRFINQQDKIIQQGFEWNKETQEGKYQSFGNPADKFLWVYKKLKQNQTIIIPVISEMPAEATFEKEILVNAGYQSIVFMPIFLFDTFSGYTGFGSKFPHPLWSEQEKGLLDIFQSTVVSVLERRQREINLKESQEKYRNLVESIPGIVYSAKCDEKLTTLFLSDAFERQTLHKKESVFQPGFSWLSIIHPDDHNRFEKKVSEGITNSTPIELEYRLKRADGEFICLHESAHITYDEKNQPVTIQGILMDVSDRKRDFEEMRRLSQENFRLMTRAYHDSEAKTVLLNEVNHRVKNNLASILGIIELEKKREIRSNEEFHNTLKALESRISGLAKVHEILSKNQWAPVQLDSLVREVIENSSSLTPIGRKLQLDVYAPTRKIWLNSRQATALALILNELTTNAIQHAFLSAEPGKIMVSIRKENKFSQTVCLEFKDNGPGWPEHILSGHTGNVGLQIIKLSVCKTLNGEIHLENDQGAVVKINFNLPPQREILPNLQSKLP